MKPPRAAAIILRQVRGSNMVAALYMGIFAMHDRVFQVFAEEDTIGCILRGVVGAPAKDEHVHLMGTLVDLKSGETGETSLLIKVGRDSARRIVADILEIAAKEGWSVTD